MMAKEKYGIRQFDFRSHEYCKYLCESSDGCYFIIPVIKSNMRLFDSKKEAIEFIVSNGLDNCEIFGVFLKDKE